LQGKLPIRALFLPQVPQIQAKPGGRGKALAIFVDCSDARQIVPGKKTLQIALVASIFKARPKTE
jgi:hypothetical protein